MTRFLAWLVMVLVLVGGLAAPASAWAQPDTPSREHQVKAAFIANFVQFVEWPKSTESTGAPLVIGILGENPFRGALEKAVEGKTVGGRALVVKRFQRVEDLNDLQVLFIPANEQARFAAVREKLGDASVLTIGEADGFAAAGGVIGFFIEEGKVRFEINVRAAERARLKIGARLLKLARVLER